MKLRVLAVSIAGGLLLTGAQSVSAQTGERAQMFKSKCLLCHSQDEARALPPDQTWQDFVAAHRSKAPWLLSAQDATTIAAYLTGEDRKAAGGDRRVKFARAGQVTQQLVIAPAARLHANVVNPRVDTAQNAYAAAELQLSGVPFFERIAQAGLPLDAELASITSEDAFWYSRYNVEAIAVQSGMGLHLVNARNLVLQANEDNVASQEFLTNLLETYRGRTGLEDATDGYWPVYAEFASGAPFLQEIPDFDDPATLRWDPTKFDKTLRTGALGYAMAGQSLWAGYLLGATHGDNLIGNDADEGYLGAILLTEVINKLYLLRDELAFDGAALGEVNPFAYQAKLKYFPHAYGVEVAYDDLSAPPKPARFTVADTSSQLADQAALLWGAAEYYYISDPKIEDAWDPLFGSPADGALFPPETHDVARGIVNVVKQNIVAMHFDVPHKSFVSSWDNGERGNELSTADAGGLLMALARVRDSLHDDEALVADVETLIEWQADYLSQKMQHRDGGFVESINVATAAQSTMPRTLLAQTMAIRGLLAAKDVTGKSEYRDSAVTAYEFMENNLWSSAGQSYRTAEGNDLSLHTPQTVASTLAALREIVMATRNEKALERFKTFFTQTVKRGGLQLAELEQAGETSDTQREALTPDTDGDGVRKPAFAGGTFGVAPVFPSVVQIATP